VHALEAGNNRDFLAFLEALDEFVTVDVQDARRAMGIGGEDGQLPALPGAGVDTDPFKHDGQQACRHLFAARYNGVIFAGIVQNGAVTTPGDQLVGDAGHRRYDHGNLVAAIDLTPDVLRDIADAVDIGDRGSAELHDEAGHGGFGRLRKGNGKRR